MIKRGILALSLLAWPGLLFGQGSLDRAPIARFGVPTVAPTDRQNDAAPPADLGVPMQPSRLGPAAPQLSADASVLGVARQSPRFWVKAEYVSWWVRGSNQPPLVTASPLGAPLASAGVLGTQGTSVLLGNDQANNGMRPGGRFTFGTWFNDAQTIGLEAGVMLIGGYSTNFSAGSNGSQIISRPFVDATTGMQAAELVSFPGLLNGTVAVRSASDPLVVADALLRGNIWDGGGLHVDFLVGYRYLHFAESLQIQENLTSVDPAAPGTSFQVNDRFATRNDFNGAVAGLATEWTLGPLSLQVSGKVALGNLRREVDINGSTVITTPGAAPLVYPGGLLALPSNSGTFTSDQVGWIRELGLTAGWQITPSIRATVGYTLLLLSDMVRPGDQIDRTVNPNLLPPALPSSLLRPTFILRDSDFWVQGIRIGVEFRF